MRSQNDNRKPSASDVLFIIFMLAFAGLFIFCMGRLDILIGVFGV